MTTLASLYLGAGGVNPSSTGVEMGGTRRVLPTSDTQWARVSYAGGGLGDCAVGIDYSSDGGTTWDTMIPYGPTLGAAGIVLATEWTDISRLAWQGEVVVRAVLKGTALSLGLLYQIAFVELQVR